MLHLATVNSHGATRRSKLFYFILWPRFGVPRAWPGEWISDSELTQKWKDFNTLRGPTVPFYSQIPPAIFEPYRSASHSHTLPRALVFLVTITIIVRWSVCSSRCCRPSSIDRISCSLQKILSSAGFRTATDRSNNVNICYNMQPMLIPHQGHTIADSPVALNVSQSWKA